MNYAELVKFAEWMKINGRDLSWVHIEKAPGAHMLLDVTIYPDDVERFNEQQAKEEK